MILVTAEQIRQLDRRAMDEAGMPGVVLMENAGRAVFNLLELEYGPLPGRKAAVFCGGGNNGGDGFVILRLLLLAGVEAVLFTAMSHLDADSLKPDAAAHLRVIRDEAVRRLEPLPEGEALGPAWRHRFDFAVDALLGTGIKDAPRGQYALAIRAINALDCPVVAVDIPSGVDSDTGAMPGDSVHAAHTVTFAYPKLGLFLFPGAQNTGKVTVSDLGFPWARLSPDNRITMLGCSLRAPTAGVHFSSSLADTDGWETLLRKRPPESNKGDYGHIGIVAGSKHMAGAPALVARAAQRTGAGLVTVLTARSVQPILAAKLDEQMTLALPEAEGSLAEECFDTICKFAEKAAVLCIGPGLTTHSETVALVHRLLLEIGCPIILDADGLNALALKPEVARERHKRSHGPLVITPHPGEAARLLGKSIVEIQADRIAAARELAGRYDAVAVLKGRYTLIADPDGRVCLNTTGNPGMATGGMGDTLTGVIGAIIGQSSLHAKKSAAPMPVLVSAAFGVHLHGLAGDLAASSRGEAGLTAGDVIDQLPTALSRLILDA